MTPQNPNSEAGELRGGRGICRYCGDYHNNVALHESNFCSLRPDAKNWASDKVMSEPDKTAGELPKEWEDFTHNTETREKPKTIEEAKAVLEAIPSSFEMAMDYIKKQELDILKLEQENASLKSKLMEAELQRENAALLLRESMRKLDKYDGVLFNTNLSPEDAHENWKIIESQFEVIVELKRKLEIAKECMKFYDKFFPSSDGKVARKMLQELSANMGEK